MIDNASMTALIRAALPDAQVEIWDRTGTMDHFDVLVKSKAFANMPLMDRHRLVEKSVAAARADGRIPPLALRTELFAS